jgi:lipopolysaccharide export LptBFGC system permease protein LptF
MTKTLFWYIFGSLLKSFLMTTAGLAAMLSFAVLLRPLTENGLDFGQVCRLLLYSLPAVCAYSLPVSALFATTMVYGRFAADNEMTAMRASGISYLSPRRFSIALPALVLGLVVAVSSLILLCFIVPAYSLKVEEVIYQNIAKVIANRIVQTHALDFENSDGQSFNVYADDAKLVADDPKNPTLQRVELFGPAWMQYEYAPNSVPPTPIPKEFWMARTALVSIDRPRLSQPSEVNIALTGGVKFPRVFSGNVQVGVGSSGFGPFEIPSIISENVKFMNIARLAELAQDPGKSEEVQVIVRGLRRMQQRQAYLAEIDAALNHKTADGTSSYQFASDTPESDVYEIGAQDAFCDWDGSALRITSSTGDNDRKVWMRETHGSQQTLFADAREIIVRAQPNIDVAQISGPAAQRMNVSVELFNVELKTQDGLETPRGSFPRTFSVPMSEEVQAVDHKQLKDFVRDPVDDQYSVNRDIQKWVIPFTGDFTLHHEQVRANNGARSELHGRASFALSCLSLVMVGCALGVTLRSGNFLNAFAASFVPALLCMTLIVSGQQTATHVPYTFGAAFKDPLPTSLIFIWGGTVAVLLAAIFMTYRLQRR